MKVRRADSLPFRQLSYRLGDLRQLGVGGAAPQPQFVIDGGGAAECPILFAYFAKRVGDGDHRCALRSGARQESAKDHKITSGGRRIPPFKNQRVGHPADWGGQRKITSGGGRIPPFKRRRVGHPAKGGALRRAAGWWGRSPAFRVWLLSSAIRSRLLPLLRLRVKDGGQECPLYTNRPSGRSTNPRSTGLWGNALTLRLQCRGPSTT